MRTRFTPLVVIIVLIIMSMALAGCERERPAPTPESGTPGVLLPVGTGTVEGSSSVGTPVPLDAASPTPALLRPAATAEPLSQPAAASGSAASSPGTYVVQRGDTLGSIAQKYGLSSKDLLAVNPTITNPDVLAVGQQIKLPSGGSASASASSGSSTASGGAQTYTVQKGDILANIAKKYGVTVAALQQANNLSNPNKIIVGQKLTIPAGSAAASTASSSASSGQTRNYTVQRGDTMSTIAVKFGVTVAALQQANGITNPDKITVGQVLRIP